VFRMLRRRSDDTPTWNWEDQLEHSIHDSVWFEEKIDRLTALVLPYNLSMNPLSHVFTEYFNMVSTVWRNPSLPTPFCGRSRLTIDDNSLGSWYSKSGFACPF